MAARPLVLTFVALGALLWSGLVEAQLGDHSYSFSGGAAFVGETDDISVRIWNDFDLRGWSIGICHDPVEIELVEVTSGADVPEDVEFEQITLEPGGWTSVVVVSFNGKEVLPLGSAQEANRAVYRPLQAGDLDVAFCDTLGDPPIQNVVVDSEGNEFVPFLFSGGFEGFEGCFPFTYIAPDRVVGYPRQAGVVVFETAVSVVECQERGPTDTVGFSMGLAHDPDVLTVLEVNEAEVLEQVNNGGGPDFLAIDLHDDGWTAGVIYAFLCCEVLIFTDPLEVLVAQYEAQGLPTDPGDPPSETSLVWSDDLGVPPVQLEMFLATGQSRPVYGQNGVIVLVPLDPEFRRGDCNDDGHVDIADGIFLIHALFLGGAPPSCDEACDANGDGFLDSSDATFIFSYRFLDGSPPPAPFPECGASEPDACLEFTSCP